MYIPNMNRIYEFAIPIRYPKQFWEHPQKAYNFMQEKVVPVIKMLKDDFKIKWYGILIHGREGGVIYTKKGQNIHYHIRFELPDVPFHVFNKKKKDYDIYEGKKFMNLVKKSLPDYCKGFGKQEIMGTEGFDNSRFVEDDIWIPWGILGMTSELVYEILNVHKKKKFNGHHLLQILHYIFNPFRINETRAKYTKDQFIDYYDDPDPPYFFVQRTYSMEPEEASHYFNWQKFFNEDEDYHAYHR